MRKTGLIREVWDVAKFPLISILIVGGCTRGVNALFNNRNVSNEKYQLISTSKGILGHEEYVEFKDSSSQIKVYPNIFGHRYSSSKLYEDLNGDKITDRIRINGPEWKFHRVQDILIRGEDYNLDKSEFEKGDKLFQKYNYK